ncbi:MAG TPA: nitrilase-related carbon-nitrogen hydrolase [Patescibacteria group bacterium]|jgi:predicted amidohydrolase|nr:nitrilase-related carbon-nitrogen hydrolase [Patescibacteria group bacterium]
MRTRRATRPIQPSRTKVVLAQIAPALGDLDRNLALHLEEIRRAVRAGADLIVFPELSLTGYLLQDLVSECGQQIGTSPYLQQLARASRQIAIVAGFVEQSPGILHHNSAGCFLGGRLVHVHRKVYLPTYAMFDEGRYFAAGEVFRTFQAPWGRTGILICEDFWHLSSSYLLAQEGMEVLIVVSNSPSQGLDASDPPVKQGSWMQLAGVVAQFFTCFVIYVNRAGYEEGWSFGGGSCAVDPSGRTLVQAAFFESDRVNAALEPPLLRKARTAYPVLRDEKLDLVRRELERIAAARYDG